MPDDFEDAFEVGTFEEFQEWLASADKGWFLLDSVDEARLRNPATSTGRFANSDVVFGVLTREPISC